MFDGGRTEEYAKSQDGITCIVFISMIPGSQLSAFQLLYQQSYTESDSVFGSVVPINTDFEVPQTGQHKDQSLSPARLDILAEKPVMP